MLKGKSLLEYTNLLSPNEYKKNDKIILFLWIDFIKVKIKKSTVFVVKSIKNLNSLKYHIFAIKHYFFLVFVTSAEMNMKKYLKNQSIEILKILGLINNIEKYQNI